MNKGSLESLGYVALLLAASLACGKGSASSDPSPAATAQGPGAGDQTAIGVKAAAILADYKGNEVRGDAKWKGKYVQVTGIVSDIKKDILDQPFVTVGTGADFEIPEVQCTLKDGQEKAAASLSKGQTIMVRGKVTGLMMNVQLEDCRVVPGAPPPAQPAPAQPAPAPARPKKR